jgi:zinc D-Ala-D-Ala carboxypeptidase
MNNISEHITYEEATFSAEAKKNGVDNIPTPQNLRSMKNLAEKIFEVVRDEFGGTPRRILSFFRTGKVNDLVNGAARSQHTRGEAIDFVGTREMFLWIKDHLVFDQLIYEYGDDENPAWIHVSLRLDGNNRNQTLRKRYKQGYELFTK